MQTSFIFHGTKTPAAKHLGSAVVFSHIRNTADLTAWKRLFRQLGWTASDFKMTETFLHSAITFWEA